jgi:sterol-4alpha-carboxylate 3-dehydrogenase (decarboxylating)
MEESSDAYTVLVTGGLGFVGSSIVRALQERHPRWQVWILDRLTVEQLVNTHNNEDELSLLKGCKYEYVRADITNGEEVSRALKQVRPDFVIHTAGIVPSLAERQVHPCLPFAIGSVHRTCRWCLPAAGY